MLERFFNILTKAFKSFLTLFKILLRSNLFLKKHTTNLKNIIILGNGPSLKNVLNENIEDLKKHCLFSVNKFPDTPAFEILKPQYFTIISKEFWEPGSISKHQENRDNIIKALIQKTTWPLFFFIPQQARTNSKFIKSIQSNPNIKICFFNNTPAEGLPFFNRFYLKQGWAMPRPHNVLIPSIFNCIFAGFENIYLLGADHSWIPLISVSEDNIAMVNQQHFYDTGQSKNEIMHRNSQPRRLHEILEKFMLSFRAYFDLKDFAATRNVNIYNCTPGSFIDAFDRKDISEVLNKPQREDTFVSKSGSSE